MVSGGEEDLAVTEEHEVAKNIQEGQDIEVVNMRDGIIKMQGRRIRSDPAVLIRAIRG